VLAAGVLGYFWTERCVTYMGPSVSCVTAPVNNCISWGQACLNLCGG
jgi:hypothetical protein